MALSFKGGVHPNGKKELTCDKPIEKLAAPSFVVLPVSMHIGAPCEPLVKKGDHVCLGQKIAESPAPVSSPVHATISGTVRDIVPMSHPNGSKVMSIIIDNDYADELDHSVKPYDLVSMTVDEKVAAIKNAGIVGHGGAAFPTHIKISSGLGKVDTVLINAAECEPYITSDHRILVEYTNEVIEGAKILRGLFGDVSAYVCVEMNKRNVFGKLQELLPAGCGIEFRALTTKYPQGSEKHLIKAVTGREVPSGKLPADAGCAVFNTDTAAAVYRLFSTGMPAVRRIVTVSGSAITEPKNLEVRIGTPVENLIEACGGFAEPPLELLMGGPMMGNALYTTDVPVIKGTNAILSFTKTESYVSKNPTCIRCGKCVNICPMRLVPTYMYMHNDVDTPEELFKLNVLDCIECGACSYVCPGKVPLLQGIRVAKQRVMDSRKKK